jgi:eukaryotic-like serine/threonine-protein kinase
MSDITSFKGRRFGQYELHERIGVGGMGAVYSGVQTNLGRKVAIKVLSSHLSENPDHVERFKREAHIVAQLEHNSIVSIYDYGFEEDVYYVVMRLLNGGTLEQRLHHNNRQDNPLPAIGEVIHVLEQIANALDYAHSKDVIHRDIKASNVMFDDHGNALLVDFGIATWTQNTRITKSGVVAGTPDYVPPERWMGEPAAAASDQYAVGIMAFELFTGRSPFVANNPYAMMNMHLNEMPPPPQSVRPELGDTLDAVFGRVLAKNPEHRYPSVTAFVSELKRAAEPLYNQSKLTMPTRFFTTVLPYAGVVSPTPPGSKPPTNQIGRAHV